MIIVDDRSYLRKLVRTRWLDEHDDLVAVLLEYGCDRHPEDTIVVSETVSLLLTGRSLLVESFQPRWDARLLARFVRPHHDTLGLSIPSKMQWVLHTVGRPRIYTAAVAAAVTRLFGVQGTFYRIAGDPARQIDGGCPPYQDRLLPPFHPAEAVELCNELQTKLGNPVAIADINDFGGSIRAVSSRSLPATTLKRVLADNPMGQLRRGTPFILVRAT
ncbi:hypothetical protein ACWDWO_27105 [Actinopolymorpha singaporensis]|uniref:hypothetical protein n=1 Tax=Actinopolymorpha singaporensis TaxID=117157 RepID=UPI001F519194|nr:hypothetical protein [Actinopolymorpha singaporensis]